MLEDISAYKLINIAKYVMCTYLNISLPMKQSVILKYSKVINYGGL
jgi:hypothetical protein